MWDLLFGTHLAGWQAMVQFWFWTGLFLGIAIDWFRRQK